MEPGITLEICVDSLGLAKAAAQGGADRIELCGPLHGGGITPSAGLAIAVRESLDLPVAMLVRPRIGEFTASDDEFEVMRQDVLFARKINIDLVVLGILHEDRTVDVERTRALVELAHPLQVTFHKAFDETPNLHQAMKEILQTGATRILSSGGRSSAMEGAPAIGELHQETEDRISLMLCGGINREIVRQVMEISGAREVHAALRSNVLIDPSTNTIAQENLQYFAESVSSLKRAINQI